MVKFSYFNRLPIRSIKGFDSLGRESVGDRRIRVTG